MLELSIVNQQIAIAGKVLQGETENPISGAIVEIITMPDKFKDILALKALQYGSQWQKMLNRPDRKVTNNEGNFYLTNLPPGDYIIETSIPTSATQYKPVRTEVTVSKTVFATVNDKPIAIIPTAMTNIVLSPTGIKGTITEENDPQKWVVNAKIQIKESGDIAISDQKGYYRFLGLESSKSGERTITLNISAIGYQQVSQKLNIQRGVVISAQNFALKLKRK